MNITEKIVRKVRENLEGKSDIAKRMVLKQLLQLIDMRRRSDYVVMVARVLQVHEKVTELSEEEALMLRCEMTNAACAFSVINDQDIESLRSALKEDLSKCSPEEVDSLEAMMRERLKDKLSDRKGSPLDGTPQGVVFACNASFNDEEFMLYPVAPITWKELRKIIVEYYKNHGFDKIEDGELGDSIHARKTKDESCGMSYTYCTIDSDMIIVSRKSFRC